MSLCEGELGSRTTSVPTPKRNVSSTTCPSTADSTLVVTVYWPSGSPGCSVTAIEAVSPCALCASPVSTLLPSGPSTLMLLYESSIGSLNDTLTSLGGAETLWNAP